jgi:hypothetical protein
VAPSFLPLLSFFLPPLLSAVAKELWVAPSFCRPLLSAAYFLPLISFITFPLFLICHIWAPYLPRNKDFAASFRSRFASACLIARAEICTAFSAS